MCKQYASPDAAASKKNIKTLLKIGDKSQQDRDFLTRTIFETMQRNAKDVDASNFRHIATMTRSKDDAVAREAIGALASIAEQVRIFILYSCNVQQCMMMMMCLLTLVSIHTRTLQYLISRGPSCRTLRSTTKQLAIGTISVFPSSSPRKAGKGISILS